MDRASEAFGARPRTAGMTAALLVALLPLVAGCGGENGGNGDGSGESRFSIGGRGLNEAVDSVRNSRRQTPPGASGMGMQEGSGAAGRSNLPSEIQSALDSGNAAYRAGNYRAALEQFESLTSEHPDVRAAWFGVFMAHRALGNTAAADSAMQRAGMGSSDATELHGSADSGTSTAPHGPMSDTTGSSM